MYFTKVLRLRVFLSLYGKMYILYIYNGFVF